MTFQQSLFRGILSTSRRVTVCPKAFRAGGLRLASTSSNGLKAAVVGVRPGVAKGELNIEDLKSNLAPAVVEHITKALRATEFEAKSGEYRLLFNVDGAPAPILSVVGLGKASSDRGKDHDGVRSAAAAALSSLTKLAPKKPLSVAFDNLGNSQAAAEGAILSSYHFSHFHKEKPGPVSISLLREDEQSAEWQKGVICAEAQNIARTLMETPGNLMTPSIFCDRANELFGQDPKVEVVVRDEAWAREQEMGAFLSVARGSGEPLKFLELIYRGGAEGEAPLALVGKGVTFDSDIIQPLGGISIKPSTDMAMMKGDMGGAACVLGSMSAIARLQPAVNVVAVIPLCENMPSGKATKPGDVVRARNGMTIEVDNTDAEGRLILADAIHYVSTTHQPHTVVELSTLTGAMDVALGGGFAGVFSTCDTLWQRLDQAGKVTGDRFWRMPLDSVYRKQIKSNVADLKNVGGRSAGSCTAAIFLKEFIPTGDGKSDDSKGSAATEEEARPLVQFAHIDIAGVMHNRSGDKYIGAGMTGRPTRSIVEFVQELANTKN
ncbi:cytosol aminopeptidase family, catalytic domain-containing protein [Phlyctochytrium arcticum]|nr:cytosol aminopeptidase family, catalytic domain-containing protein [Phlyctochytrium arcticum]